MAARAHHNRGGVPDTVTQLLGFSDGEVTVEAQCLGPGVEVLSDEDQLQPGLVADEVLAGQVAQSAVFGSSDAVLDMSPVRCRNSSAAISVSAWSVMNI